MSSEKSIRINRSKLSLKHHPSAHTDGDIAITFEEADILHAGDIYWNGIYPFIDYSTGGSIDGTIRAVAVLLTSITDRTIIVPGHGPSVSTKSELKSYHDMLVAIREAIAALKRQGRSLDEIVAARPTAQFDDKWGQFVINPAFFTRLVHHGV